jgi:hypothetical protein
MNIKTKLIFFLLFIIPNINALQIVEIMYNPERSTITINILRYILKKN